MLVVDGLQLALRDRYTIERELGRGGMATVYLATDIKVDRRVAIKVLIPELAAALGGERFLREIQIASHLTHPNILPVYDSGEADGTLYYVMPFVEGESLRDRLNRERQLGIDDAIRITCQVASALDHAHAAGIVHRDIKPENILLEAGQAVVADFGIARAITSAADVETLTRTGMSLGTPTYMSPEQAMGERNLDGRSDQYALACVTYEMLAGQPPFTASTMQALVARHIAEEVPLLTPIRHAVTEEVQDVILEALEKVPADRFPTVGQFAEALAEAGSLTMSATTRRKVAAQPVRHTTRYRVAKRATRGKLVAIAAGLLVAGSAAAAAVWALRKPSPPSISNDAGAFDPKRVAVLYFEDKSTDHSLAYLADGLTESLIDQLDHVKALDVLSKNGVAPFRGANVNVDSVASVLRAGTLVRGSVEPFADQVRVNIRIIDGSSGAERDHASFLEPITGILAVRAQLADRVAQLLRQRLGPEVRLREERAATTNAEAWSNVQRAAKVGREARELAKADSAGAGARRFALADSLLARAEAVDPKWPTPIIDRGTLALRQAEVIKDDLEKSKLIARGLGHVQRALALDPRNASAFELRGTLRFRKRLLGLAPDPTESAELLRTAEADLRQATTIDPSLASAWNTLSLLLYQKFNKVESNLAARRAYEEDAYLAAAPDIIWRLYATSYDLEQFVDASQWCDVGGKRYPADPRYVSCRLWLMTTNVRPPDVAEAWRLLGELQKLSPKSTWEMKRRETEMLIAVPIARAGLRDSARRVIARARAGPDLDPRSDLVGFEVIIRTLIGDKDEALRILKVYLTSHPEHRAGYVNAHTWWYRPLQDDPRFKAMVGTGG